MLRFCGWGVLVALIRKGADTVKNQKHRDDGSNDDED